MKKWTIAVGIIVALIGVGLYKTTAIKADVDKENHPVVDRLVEKFGLNEDEVFGVFDEMHQERQEQRKKIAEERLDKAVQNGVISQEQKQALLDKQAEMQKERQQKKEEMKQWFEDNGIDPVKLAPYRVGFGCRGFGPGHRLDGFK